MWLKGSEQRRELLRLRCRKEVFDVIFLDIQMPEMDGFEVCQILKDKYLTHQRVWASYGEYDKNQFQKQCQSSGVKYPFTSKHINVKTLLALVRSLPREVGMAQALELLNLPLEGTHHRGVDDAWNIGKILSELLWNSY